ncbi:MAG: glucosamine-6-phosphate deaminase [Alkalibacterium sp.]|uniref:glucosamine-6-phosphate deaminase n=1 Tax=Alkalibacterium sp. TaxID=1872447 RepID=UPI0039705407
MNSTNPANIKIEIVKDKEEGAKVALQLIRKAVNEGATVFGLATGSTPEMLYKELRASDIDFSDKIAINLDEYIGLDVGHPQSYKTFMQKQLFDKKPFKETHIPHGLAPEETEINRYNDILEKYPIDVQILGIGTNAHIGFNEPGTSFSTKTHKVELTKETIEANKRNFDSEKEVPEFAYSMGIASIMAAKKIILMAYGKRKAEAVAKAVNGPVVEDVPASILQRHPDVVIIVDEEAASQL